MVKVQLRLYGVYGLYGIWLRLFIFLWRQRLGNTLVGDASSAAIVAMHTVKTNPARDVLHEAMNLVAGRAVLGIGSLHAKFGE